MECDVRKVYDGDTMTLYCRGEETKVRLYCIDTPEMGQKPWGRKSRDVLRALAGNRVVLIPKEKDRYGRTVGIVLSGDEDRENLNLAMVWSGDAVVYPKYCHDSDFYVAEDNARQIRAGIWERPGLHQTPWEWRRSNLH